IFNFLLEEMGERIDDLEKHVTDLMTEAGIENTDEELRICKHRQTERGLTEDRLEKRANRNLMKFKAKCQGSPLGQVDTEDQNTMPGNADTSDKPSSSTL
ncbi:PREDICTED: heat shock factor-binding protein 1-like protein 1, partial [Phaethon lepturus]|uniref:heat shock factor-binding protein 1-like protein 1 n=1 Tax=Phaethon lepturus TaxID=97097 RepID=UPI00053048FE